MKPQLNFSQTRQWALLGPGLAVALISCQRGAIEQDIPQPQANSPNGTSLLVQGIETKGDRITLDLLAINGSEDRINLSSRNDPLQLADQAGNIYPYVEEEVELAPYSVTSLKVPFAGEVSRATKELTLITNSRYSNDSRDPEIRVANIPIRKGRRTEFAPFQPRRFNLTNKFAQHPNASTLRLKQIEYGSQKVRVAFEAINGLDKTIELAGSSSDPPFLEDARSNRYYLIPASTNPDLSIPANQKLTGVLHFAGRVPAEAGQLSLHFNQRYGSSDYDEASDPKLAIAGIPTGQGGEEATLAEGGEGQQTIVQGNGSSLPATQTLDLQANSEEGSVLRINQIGFAEDSITLALAITNGSNRSIELNEFDRMFLRDNRGGKYNLKPPPQNPQVEVTPGSTLTGKFVFLGRIAPAADSLALFTDGFRIENISVTGSSAIAAGDNPGQPGQAPNAATKGLPGAESLDLQTSHPNGSVLRVNQVTYTEDSIDLTLAVTNGLQDTIKLNSNKMILRDNAGNQYNLKAPPQNPDVEITPGSTLKGKLVFLGRVSPSADSLTLVTNSQHGSTDYRGSTRPKMTINAIPVRR